MRVIWMPLVAIWICASGSTKIGSSDWKLDNDVVRLAEGESMKKTSDKTKADQETSEVIAKKKLSKLYQKRELSNQKEKGKKGIFVKPPEVLMEVKKPIEIQKKEQKVKHPIPLWILNGGKYESGISENYLYAVGMASDNDSDLVLKVRSEDNARENLIGKISEFKMMMDHGIESSSLKLESLTEEDKKELRSVILKITSTLMAEVELPEFWKNPMQSERYTLARISLVPFKKAYQETSTLGKSAKTYLKIIFEKSWRAYIQKVRDGHVFIKNGKRYVLKGNRYYFY